MHRSRGNDSDDRYTFKTTKRTMVYFFGDIHGDADELTECTSFSMNLLVCQKKGRPNNNHARSSNLNELCGRFSVYGIAK